MLRKVITSSVNSKVDMLCKAGGFLAQTGIAVWARRTSQGHVPPSHSWPRPKMNEMPQTERSEGNVHKL